MQPTLTGKGRTVNILDVCVAERVKELVPQVNTTNPAQGFVDVFKKAGGFFGK